MFLADKLTLDAPRRTADGYLIARAKAARAGIYQYRGNEVDPSGKHFSADETVNAYRPESEVFDQASVASFLMKPITNDHPAEPVTADNWKQYAKGIVGKALRDGEHLAFDIVLMDSATIADVEAGKRELSNGYRCELEIGDGVAPDGTKFAVTQHAIRGNHVAVVRKGKAGPTCRIGDAALCDSAPADLLAQIIADGRTYNPTNDDGNNSNARRETSNFEEAGQVATKTITFDGLPVEVTDAAEAVIVKLQGQLKDAADTKAKADEKIGELTATISTKDGEIAALNQKVTDAAITPEKLETLVADRAALVTAAKAVVPTILTDGKTEAEIRKAVVEAKLGDAAKDMDDAAIGGAFKVLANDKADPVRDAIRDGVRIKDGTAEVKSARAKWLTDKETAYRGQAA